MFCFNLEFFFKSIFILVCLAVQAASLHDYYDVIVKLTFETENVKTVLKEFSQINHMNRC